MRCCSIMGHGEEIGVIPRFCEELFGRIHAGLDGVVRITEHFSFYFSWSIAKAVNALHGAMKH